MVAATEGVASQKGKAPGSAVPAAADDELAGVAGGMKKSFISGAEPAVGTGMGYAGAEPSAGAAVAYAATAAGTASFTTSSTIVRSCVAERFSAAVEVGLEVALTEAAAGGPCELVEGPTTVAEMEPGFVLAEVTAGGCR